MGVPWVSDRCGEREVWAERDGCRGQAGYGVRGAVGVLGFFGGHRDQAGSGGFGAPERDP